MLPRRNHEVMFAVKLLVLISLGYWVKLLSWLSRYYYESADVKGASILL